MKISVLMSNYNNSEYIDESISSVINQTYNDWELIIVDDNSTDNSLEKINRYKANKKIKLFENENNIGYIKTLEKSINSAQNDLLIILDSDDTLEKDALYDVVDVFKNKDIGFVYSGCNYCNKKLTPFKTGSKKLAEGVSNIFENHIVALRSFKRSVYRKTAGLDEDCLFAEDFDLNLKLEEITKFHFIDKTLYNYRILKNSQTHGFKNEMINKSSVALARLKAVKRRYGTDISSLDKTELFEVLVWGVMTSLLSQRFTLSKIFIIEVFKSIYLVLNPRLYYLIIKKTIKIILFKTNKI